MPKALCLYECIKKCLFLTTVSHISECPFFIVTLTCPSTVKSMLIMLKIPISLTVAPSEWSPFIVRTLAFICIYKRDYKEIFCKVKINGDDN